MEIIQKELEFQLDKKPGGYVIRVNDEHGCILRICQIPFHLVEDKNGIRGYIDIAYPNEEKIEWIIKHPGTGEKIIRETFEECMEKDFEGFNLPFRFVNGESESFEEANFRVSTYFDSKK